MYFSPCAGGSTNICIYIDIFIYVRPQILQHLGLSLADFKDHAAAFKACDEEIARNRAEHGHGVDSFPVQEADHPLLTKYWYVSAHGKTRTWSQEERKTLSGDTAVKGVHQIHQSRAFVEALGPSSSQEFLHTYICT